MANIYIDFRQMDDRIKRSELYKTVEEPKVGPKLIPMRKNVVAPVRDIR